MLQAARFRRSSILFVCGFTLILVRELLVRQYYVAIPELATDCMFAVGCVCGVLFILLRIRRENIVKASLVVLIVAIGLISKVCSGETAGFTLVLLVGMVAFSTDVDGAIKLWFGISISWFSLLAILTLLLVVFNPAKIEVFVRSEYDLIPRYSLGFEHPNAAASFLLMLNLSSWYLCMRSGSAKHRLCSMLFSFISIILIMLIMRSRVALVLLIASIPLFLLTSIGSKKLTNLIRVVCSLLPLGFVGLTYYLGVIGYEDSMGSMLTNRVRLWHSALTQGGITVFGQPFYNKTYISADSVSYAIRTIDGGYTYALAVLGLALLAVVIILNLVAAYRAPREALPILLIWACIGFTETISMWICFCGPVLVLAYAMKGEKLFDKSQPSKDELRNSGSLAA